MNLATSASKPTTPRIRRSFFMTQSYARYRRQFLAVNDLEIGIARKHPEGRGLSRSDFVESEAQNAATTY